MSIFSFWKKKEISEKTIVGRHQQLLLVNKFLGQGFNEMEWQIAKNKDVSEYNEILEEVKKLEEYVKSEIFTTQLDVLQAKNDATDILKKGNSSCVLQNNDDLDARVCKILQNPIEYAVKLAKLAQDEESNLNKLISYHKIEGILIYMDLSGLLVTGDQQMAWLILSNRVSQTLSILSPEKVLDYVENFRIFIKKLSEEASKRNDEFTQDELRRLGEIEAEVRKGLELNKASRKSKSQ
ncbi:MAG: hypothetical protein WC628_01905 [Candidatus Omnitrophota bacterium]